MKWLIVGTNWISKNFARALHNNNETAYGVVSRNINKARVFSQENGIEEYFNDYDKGLEGTDVVYIATPNSTHFEYAKKAIELNKHVMVEKPMTMSTEETKELFELSEKHNVTLKEAYKHLTYDNVRDMHPRGNLITTNFMRYSDALKEKEYTKVSSLNKSMGGGALRDLGPYPISLLVMKFGTAKDVKISNVKWFGEVDITLDVLITFDKIVAKFTLSKLENGDNAVYLDGRKILDNVSSNGSDNKMDDEVKRFKEDYQEFKGISLEAARIIDEISILIDKEKTA